MTPKEDYVKLVTDALDDESGAELTPEDYLESLEEIAGSVEARLAGVRDDLRNR